MGALAFDDDLCRVKALQDHPGEHIVPMLGVKALAVVFLQGWPLLDVGSLCADGGVLLPPCLGDELRSIVRSDLIGATAQVEQMGHRVDEVGRTEPPADLYRHAFAAELVDDDELGGFPTVKGSGFPGSRKTKHGLDAQAEVDAPPIILPDTVLLWLVLWGLQLQSPTEVVHRLG